ncbi:hypothetical protein DSCW_59670 [Desulfosarcina widdelii]|uniref:Uncharacterized protein n=1 Tax=Desulfosarcina widdelii TaxID=947919 RepID=A0A5K7ZCK2_9BACT|nr:hypothetical protein [Desulfosarcina widdelii]BBO78550.1 hypothetical protein DSCW_59670 [Desulfosarcina widdelii]
MRTLSLSICFVLSLLLASSAVADDNTCWILAPQQNDVWVIVYDADADGNRKNIIWKGKIAAGQKIKVESKDGFIRYQSKPDPSQPYSGDVPVGCFEQRSYTVDFE